MNRSLAAAASFFFFTLGFGPTLPAQTPPAPSGETQDSASTADDPAADEPSRQSDREQRLAEHLSGTKFVGKFTVDGNADTQPKTEQYTILQCEKLPAENMYRFTTRIQYGEVDSEVPMELRVLWSGDTPVITLDDLWIPTLGTFSARVLIHSDRYAGTWQHGDAGGHLFGKIQKIASEQ